MSAALEPVPSGTIVPGTPPDLDVALIVRGLDVAEVKPWDQVLPGFGTLFVERRCVCSGPLDQLGAEAVRFPGARLALHPDDVAKLHGPALAKVAA